MPFEKFEKPSIPPIEKKEKIKEGLEEKPEEVKEKLEERLEEEKFKEVELEKIRAEIGKVSGSEKESIEKEEAEKEKERKLEITKEVIKETLPKEFRDWIGDDSEKAWKEREKLEKKDPIAVCASLAGISSEKSREWLDKRKEIQKLWWGVSRGLVGDESEKAWQIREYLRFDQRVQRLRGGRWSLLRERFGLHKSERLFNLRGKIKRVFPGWYEPGDVVISTLGLESEKAWNLREELEKIAPAEVLISLAGNNSEKAWEIRRKYEKDKKLRWAYEKSLIGVGK